MTFHRLRHGSATAQLAAGTTPRVISEALGHSRTAFTMDTYVHVMPDVQKEAAEAAAAIVPRRARPARGPRPGPWECPRRVSGPALDRHWAKHEETWGFSRFRDARNPRSECGGSGI